MSITILFGCKVLVLRKSIKGNQQEGKLTFRWRKVKLSGYKGMVYQQHILFSMSRWVGNYVWWMQSRSIC